MPNLSTSGLDVPSIFPLTIDPEKPCVALGMPKSVYEALIHNVAELVSAILNCGSAELRTDSETEKDFYLFKRNPESVPEINNYLNEALRIVQMICQKVATLMSEQGISDDTENGEYWRILIDLKKDWQSDFPFPGGVGNRNYGCHEGAISLQWNENKGVLRIKTKTLQNLLDETVELVKTLIAN